MYSIHIALDSFLFCGGWLGAIGSRYVNLLGRYCAITWVFWYCFTYRWEFSCQFMFVWISMVMFRGFCLAAGFVQCMA